MSHYPCHSDCSDFTDDPRDDYGCCGPIPVRVECGAPVLPVAECDEDDIEMEFDPETEEFFAVGKLFDSVCSALTDSNGSILTGLVA